MTTEAELRQTSSLLADALRSAAAVIGTTATALETSYTGNAKAETAAVLLGNVAGYLGAVAEAQEAAALGDTLKVRRFRH